MLLDDKAAVFRRLDASSPARLRGFREVALGLVNGKLAGCHRMEQRCADWQCSTFVVGRAKAVAIILMLRLNDIPGGCSTELSSEYLIALEGSALRRCNKKSI